jgi:hypothetical protein
MIGETISENFQILYGHPICSGVGRAQPDGARYQAERCPLQPEHNWRRKRQEGGHAELRAPYHLRGLGSAPQNSGHTDSGTVETRIYLTPSQDATFKVCDGNGFDAAVDCLGNSKSTNGAVFQLPCNTNIPDDQDYFVPCDESIAAATSYSVYARALAKPGGQAIMTTCATDEDTGETVCSTESTLLVRATGKSLWQNETNALQLIQNFLG